MLHFSVRMDVFSYILLFKEPQKKSSFAVQLWAKIILGTDKLFFEVLFFLLTGKEKHEVIYTFAHTQKKVAQSFRQLVLETKKLKNPFQTKTNSVAAGNVQNITQNNLISTTLFLSIFGETFSICF